jgi:hypothetical protein
LISRAVSWTIVSNRRYRDLSDELALCLRLHGRIRPRRPTPIRFKHSSALQLFLGHLVQ